MCAIVCMRVWCVVVVVGLFVVVVCVLMWLLLFVIVVCLFVFLGDGCRRLHMCAIIRIRVLCVLLLSLCCDLLVVCCLACLLMFLSFVRV